jgi:hypothetical protein
MVRFGLDLDKLRGEKAPLYHRYEGRTTPQDAYVAMTEDGEVSAYYSGEIGKAIPMDVWNGRTLRWRVNPQLRGDALVEALIDKSTLALLGRIHAGHSVKWDGRNHVGRLTDDARDASFELECTLDRLSGDPDNLAVVLDVEEWLWSANSLTDVWPERESLDEVVERLKNEVEDDPRLVVDGDFRESLLARAEWYFKNVDYPIGRVHLDALLADGRITEDERSEYIRDYEIGDSVGDTQEPL